jgi:hypothetical protein
VPIDPTATYSVAANESVIFILDYLRLPYSNVQLYEGVTEFQVVADYIINQGGFIHPKKLGRILNVGDQQSRGMLYAGGWMISEAGFYLPDPTVTGRAFLTINLLNKFNSGELVGKVRLDLRKANFRFRSTECDWLLIENSFATVVGKGKVNGTGSYGFLLTAQSEIEGMECPQGAVRIIIWDSDENIVYDNLLPQNMNGGIFIRNIIGDEENTIAKTENENLTLPVEYALEQNYPNPFNPTTTIKYSIPETGNVELRVYDIIGNEVAILVDETKAPGSYEIPFDASKLASGIYIYSLRAANFVQTKKMILMK